MFLQLEAFGFCGPGEANDFIAGGNIEVGGKIPVNTNGGLLGEAYIHGMNNILEGVRQVRGTAANQVDGAEHVLVSAGRSGLVLVALIRAYDGRFRSAVPPSGHDSAASRNVTG